ncbi:Gfo/Idh/MocA family protein [Leucobacter luti]|uniref:Myo-inositol 2-dehydrogenase/D-chiro-inositol 1-dehydrogenase n=1 Tax=Leucobacter luti TaxID=340320 RepID=A0A4Q7U3E4_9MICO|nr:Gfo/Idh/MocA family oxidoreductase [Leucobacter luti]MBL3699398.1 inositol 2-dehydrogenase [Leucobacter luti]RZT66908.1 myo-inositol 2-dehydrogenase/D-chiro-inositol 1-dehydrogenase [Leucobacter luti]
MRIGIIGTGVMGAFHAGVLHREVSGATVTAVADLDPERAGAAAAAIPGAVAFTDPAALIANDAVDAVLIASPDALHAEQTLACIAAGKPTLCEKPLSYSVDEAERVLAAHRAAVGAGIPLVHQGFMRRFDPGYVEQRRIVASGAHGRPLMVHSIGRGVASGPGATDESVIFNSAIHDLDLVPWLVGAPVTEVAWHAPAAPSGTAGGLRDPFLLLLRTADGGLSTVETFLNSRAGYDMRCEVVCETGTVAITEPHRTVTVAGLAASTGVPGDFRPRFADAYRLELQEWVTALGAGRAPHLATVADGAQATRVAAAAVASMRAGGGFVPVAVAR